MARINDDYTKFCEILNSDTTAHRYDNAMYGEEVVSYQMYGFSAAMVVHFWARYKRERQVERRNHPRSRTFYKPYRFSAASAALHKAAAWR